ncbi:hypothetical protein GCM10025867_02620 [Frondihabitans sucicola]|uniref:IPT/TIG domain-containing protein n=1 Tax=Frondihabitans sucicola TaxID=1268041 RepID=A0ABM8GI22_9MICO|nr:hypothetical protein GCM10025867_02620 [Frondihabitans sucicola]
MVGVVSVAIVTTALLAGCTAGGGGATAPATLGEASPLKSSSPGGSGTPAAAAVASVSPASGSLVSGEKATITGTSLTGVDKVTFNGVAATDVAVVNARTVTAVVPAAVDYQPSAGAVAVFKGSAQVPGSALTYTWSTQTGVDREMQYAFAHWNATTYNASYINFNAVGGDCQNFVSQSLLARGLKQTDSWYYNSSGSHSESWGYAPAFDTLLKSTPSLGFTPLDSTQRSQLSVGDLAYFDWNDNGVPDHVMIVSRVASVDGQTKVSLVGHNLDYDYRDLDTTITKDHPGAKVWFYKVPASL